MLIQNKKICYTNNYKQNAIPFSAGKNSVNSSEYNMQSLQKIAHYNKHIIRSRKVEKISDIYPLHDKKHYMGCILGGAIGDALGKPVEFYSLPRIEAKYGKDGITDLELVDKKAQFTDDTQMTIFTADGLIKSYLSKKNLDTLPDMDIIYQSYQDWLSTQRNQYNPTDKGWLSNLPDLYALRAPGLTCTGTLLRGKPGSIESPINNSKGCGGIMRTAPAGLMYYNNPKLAFEVGARCAALTHGSPDAYLPAGFHSALIANIIGGNDIETSVNKTMEILKEYDNHQNVLSLVKLAKNLADSDMDSKTAIEILGEGWHGDEALAISVYCILKSPDDFEKAVIMAVNHSGDSDSTGSIVGNILGAYLGADKIPPKWKNNIELSSQLSQIAADLYAKPKEIPDSDKRYPTS